MCDFEDVPSQEQLADLAFSGDPASYLASSKVWKCLAELFLWSCSCWGGWEGRVSARLALAVHLETQLKTLVTEPILAAWQLCSWHWLLYQIPAETVEKPYRVLGSSGSCRADEHGQVLPVCLPTLSAPAHGQGFWHTCSLVAEGSVYPLPGQAKQKDQRVSCPRNRVSSYFAPCYEIN